MLPTHVVRMPSISSPPSSSCPKQDEGIALAEASQQEESDGFVYPPSTSAVGTARTASRQRDGMLGKVFGDRGIVGLTVDVPAPATGSSSYRRRPTSNGPKTDPTLDSGAVSANAVQDDTAAIRSSTRGEAQPRPSRWHTWEFRLYYLVFLTIVPLMVWIPIKLSLPSNPQYLRFSHHLRPGWLFGRMRDDSDFQYRSFRDYVPALVAIMAVYVALSKLFSLLPSFGGRTAESGSNGYRPLTAPSSATQHSPRRNRLLFLHVFSAIFILALHGANTAKLLTILLVQYGLAHLVAGYRWLAPMCLWAFNISALAAVHWNDGFQWQTIGSSGQLAWLEEYNGLLPRWQINFNITMLRLVSFGLDLHWAKLAAASTSSPRATSAQQSASLMNGEKASGATDNRLRSSTPRPVSDYSLAHYFAYTLYPPLFIAGPILSFNDFVDQIYRPPAIPTRTLIRYGLRFLISLLTMEFILHFMYVNAIKETPKAFVGQTPLELSMLGFWNLIVVWLKLLIPWRFFRLWSLADGVDPPENMIRCMANNYSTMGFWRSWHRSYNMWIVR